MKLKRWHLFLFTFIAFISAFYAINTKYDRFARIEGIDNDRRALILNYLSEDEQEYLVMQAIPMAKFEKYMQDDNFYLPHYQFYLKYNELLETEEISDIVSKANYSATRLKLIDSNQAYNYLLRLLDDDLLTDFENNEDFNFNYYSYYMICKKYYADDRYIEDVKEIVNSFAALGIGSKSRIEELMNQGLSTYSSQAFKTLLKGSPYFEDATLLYTFDDSIVLNETNYIGSYTPQNLVLINEVNRLYYHMYLREDVYEALLTLKNDFVEQTGNHHLTVLMAYQAYNTLLQNGQYAGHDQFQLGTVISLKQDGVDPNQLEGTQLGIWLKENAHKYGFILRYPSDKEDVTNHVGVAHIYRYVGIDLATYMYENNLCLEEVNE